jgi:hypothetical protein
MAVQGIPLKNLAVLAEFLRHRGFRFLKTWYRCEAIKPVAVQGIPLKNLAVVGCRPLLSWALGAARRFPQFDSLWVSTDHQGTPLSQRAISGSGSPSF